MSEQQRTGGGPLDADDAPAAGTDPAVAVPPPDGAEAGGPSAPPRGTAPPRRRRWTLVPFATLVGLVLAVVVAAVWWQARRGPEPATSPPTGFATGADDRPTDRAVVSEPDEADALRARLADLESQITELTRALDAERRARETLDARLEPLTARLADFDRRLATLQGAPFEARTEWLRAQAEYYLALASSELALAGRWDTAIAALELADDVLVELGDPSLAPVREAIAAERLELTSVELPDTEGLALTLGQIAARAGELPLRAELPANYEPPRAQPDEQPPGFGRFVSTVKNALSGLVRVERRSAPLAPELSAAERVAVRRALELELTLARSAAASARGELFADAVARALELLRRDFDTDAAEVASTIRLLEELGRTNVAPARPTLGRALALLRGISGGGD